MRRFTAWLSLPLCLALISLLSNLATETSLVFLPLYAKSIGSSNLEIGFIAAAYSIAFFLSALIFGRLSDRYGRLGFIRAGMGLSALAYLSQAFALSPMALLAARGTVGFCLGISSAAVMAYTFENQNKVGNFAAYGSLGWLIGAFVSATVKDYHALFLVSAIASALAGLASLMLREESTTRTSVAALPLSLVKADYKIYLGFFLRQLGATAIWSIYPLYLASIGATKFWIAMMDAINNVTQFAIMRYVEKFNPARMFQLGLVLTVIVFIIYGTATSFWQILPVQVLLAISWSCLLIGSLSYLLRRNRERGTTTGLLYSSMYLSSGLGPFIGGAVAQVWGYMTLMFVGAGISLLGVISARGLGKDKGKG